MPKLADLPIRRVRSLEPRELTEFRVAHLPEEWKEDIRPAHPETGVFTIEEVLLTINEEMSIVPPVEKRLWRYFCAYCFRQIPDGEVNKHACWDLF